MFLVQLIPFCALDLDLFLDLGKQFFGIFDRLS